MSDWIEYNVSKFNVHCSMYGLIVFPPNCGVVSLNFKIVNKNFISTVSISVKLDSKIKFHQI